MFNFSLRNREKSEPNLHELMLAFGVLGTLTFIATILSYQDFFLFNPLDTEDPVRRFFLFLTTVGWITSLVGPITLLTLNALGKHRAIDFLSWAALAWPVSLILNHSALLIESRKLFIGYLAVYPIFIITDIALPIMYLLIARFLKHKKH
jgi:hypothetical protein